MPLWNMKEKALAPKSLQSKPEIKEVAAGSKNSVCADMMNTERTRRRSCWRKFLGKIYRTGECGLCSEFREKSRR